MSVSKDSSLKSVHFWGFSVKMLGRMSLFEIAASFEYACLMILPRVTTSGLLLWIVPSVFFLWIGPSTENNIHSLTQTAAHIYNTVSFFAVKVNNAQSIPVRRCWLPENLQVIKSYFIVVKIIPTR